MHFVPAPCEPERVHAGSATDVGDDRRWGRQVTGKRLAGSLSLQGPVTGVEPVLFQAQFVIVGNFPV